MKRSFRKLGKGDLRREGSLKRLVVAATVSLLLLSSFSTGAFAGKPGPQPGTSACPLPATDLCTSYVFRGYRWASMPIRYYINLAGAPAGAEQDIQDAFLAWEQEIKSPSVEAAYPGDRSNVRFQYMGLTTSTGIRDGKNVVFFAACDGCDAGFLKNRIVQRKSIVEFDIQFNSARPWTTDVTCPTHDCGALDLQNVTTHEIGHVLDLYHVTAGGGARLTMYPGAAPDETLKRDLAAGDILGLRAAYPN